MAITFTNTSGTGFNADVYNGNVPDTSPVIALATPSDAASGKLLLQFYGAISAIGTPHDAQTPSLPNVTAEASATSVRYGGTAFEVELHALYAQLTGSPTNLNVNEPDGSPQRIPASVALIIGGFDTGDPIRASATNSGRGTTITFPDTTSVNDGDMVIRAAVVGKEDWANTFSAFGGTEIYNNPRNGVGGPSVYVGYSTKSGAGAPGTATLTQTGTLDWVAMTIVVAVDAVALTKKLKLLAHPSAVGATGCTVEVFAEPSAGDLTGTKFGKATGQEWVTGTGADTGFAVMKIPVADFDGDVLAVNDTPVALVENTTHAAVRLADPYSIVIEE